MNPTPSSKLAKFSALRENVESPKQHTPTPWKVSSSNECQPTGDGGESFSEFLTIEGAAGELICEFPGHSQWARGNDTTKREDANAELVVRCVNSHDQLLAALNLLVEHAVVYACVLKVNHPEAVALPDLESAIKQGRAAIEAAERRA